MSSDDWAGACFLAIIVAICVTAVWAVVTDEYIIVKQTACVQDKIEYVCKVENGGVVMQCGEDRDACNKACMEMRKSN